MQDKCNHLFCTIWNKIVGREKKEEVTITSTENNTPTQFEFVIDTDMNLVPEDKKPRQRRPTATCKKCNHQDYKHTAKSGCTVKVIGREAELEVCNCMEKPKKK